MNCGVVCWLLCGIGARTVGVGEMFIVCVEVDRELENCHLGSIAVRSFGLWMVVLWVEISCRDSHKTLSIVEKCPK